MTDLYDEMFGSDRFARDKWSTEPDFDETFVWEDDEPSDEDDELEISLEDWLASS